MSEIPQSRPEKMLNGLRGIWISEAWTNAEVYEFGRLIEGAINDLDNALDDEESHA